MGVFLPDAGDVNVQLVADTSNTWADPGDIDHSFKVTLGTTTAAGFEMIENSDDEKVTDLVPSSITFDSIKLVKSTLNAYPIDMSDVDVVI